MTMAIVEWVGNEFSPEEVFSDALLAHWAEEHGYKLVEE